MTSFYDGSVFYSHPHQTADYYLISQRCGYGEDVLAYCREHDFFHTFLAEWVGDKPSSVLWELAHDREDKASAIEELAVQACQRWVRAGERPIVGGVDWDGFKTQGLHFLDRLNGFWIDYVAKTHIEAHRQLISKRVLG